MKNSTGNQIALTAKQAKQIVNAAHKGKGTSIMLSAKQIGGKSKYMITLTGAKPGLNKISKTQVGGILPFLAPIVAAITAAASSAAPALAAAAPAIATGALGGLGSAATGALIKEIAGSGVRTGSPTAKYVSSKGLVTIRKPPVGGGLYRIPNPQRRSGGSITKDARAMLVATVDLLKNQGLIPNSATLSAAIKKICNIMSGEQ